MTIKDPALTNIAVILNRYAYPAWHGLLGGRVWGGRRAQLGLAAQHGAPHLCPDRGARQDLQLRGGLLVCGWRGGGG